MYSAKFWQGKTFLVDLAKQMSFTQSSPFNYCKFTKILLHQNFVLYDTAYSKRFVHEKFHSFSLNRESFSVNYDPVNQQYKSTRMLEQKLSLEQSFFPF